MSLPIALQLYTVRDHLSQDFEGTLKEVAKIGFKYVEFAGLYDNDPAAVKQLCDDLGLTTISSHTALPQLEEGHIGASIEQALVMGYRHIVCPFLPNEWRTAEGYQDIAIRFNAIGDTIHQQGLAFGYHNHSFEFEVIDGHRGMDTIFDKTGSELVNSELDVYWVQHGNDDPIAWMDKLKGRVPLLHIKDMADTPERGFAEVGTGTVDIPAIVKHAPSVGAEYLIVEQDSGWNGTPLESAATSYENLVKIVNA